MRKKSSKKEKGGPQPPTPASQLFTGSEAMEAIRRLEVLRDELNDLLRRLTEAGFSIDLHSHSPLVEEDGELRNPFPQLDVRVYHVLVDTTKTGSQPVLQDPLDDNWDSTSEETEE